MAESRRRVSGGRCNRERDRQVDLRGGGGFPQHVVLRDQQSLCVQRGRYRRLCRGVRAGSGACREKALVTLALECDKERESCKGVAMKMPRKTVLIFLAATIVAGCGARDDDVTLTRIRNTGNGPDEFSIIPGKPLQAPEDLSALPVPTPGGSNRTDQNPLADGIAALGGNPAAVNAQAPAASNGALVNHANRYGGTPDIRQTLAQEDREIRRSYGR